MLCTGLFRYDFGNHPTQHGRAVGGRISVTVSGLICRVGALDGAVLTTAALTFGPAMCHSKVAAGALVSSRTSESLQGVQLSEGREEM